MANAAPRGERRSRSSRATFARRRKPARPSATVVPWYLIVLGVAVAASTSVAQQRAVAILSAPGDNTDPLPNVAPDWMKESRRARTLWTTVNRVINRLGEDNLSLVAAGIAFYAMFSIFPALGAIVSIYGLFGDTHVVQAQVQQLTELLPRESAMLLDETLNKLLAKPSASLNFGLVVSLGVAIVAARNGVSSMMSGLNMAMKQRETRSVITLNAMAIVLTLASIIFAIVVLTAVAIIPIAVNVLPVDDQTRTVLAYARWPVLGVFVILAIDLVYRFAPSVERPSWHFFSVGTLFSTALWVLGSYAFSQYVTRFGSYDTTYGSLGAVIVLLLWFWISAFIILTGAVIDAVRADMKRV